MVDTFGEVKMDFTVVVGAEVLRAQGLTRFETESKNNYNSRPHS